MERQIRSIIISSIYGVGASQPLDEKPKDFIGFRFFIFNNKTP